MISTMTKTNFVFPFEVADSGRIQASGGDEALRGKVIQLLFTAPGERVHQPEFGCGLFNLVFEPNNDILAAAVEFSVQQALSRWLADEISVTGVKVSGDEGTMMIEIVYAKRGQLAQQAVRVQFR